MIAAGNLDYRMRPICTLSFRLVRTLGREQTYETKINSKRQIYSNWYLIDGNSPISPAEDCNSCDELDDSLFYEDCWLCHVDHVHGEPIKDTDTFTYLYKGKTYETTYGLWLEGYRMHIELGEMN